MLLRRGARALSSRTLGLDTDPWIPRVGLCSGFRERFGNLGGHIDDRVAALDENGSEIAPPNAASAADHRRQTARIGTLFRAPGHPKRDHSSVGLAGSGAIRAVSVSVSVAVSVATTPRPRIRRGWRHRPNLAGLRRSTDAGLLQETPDDECGISRFDDSCRQRLGARIDGRRVLRVDSRELLDDPLIGRGLDVVRARDGLEAVRDAGEPEDALGLAYAVRCDEE
jgi:hypothetical protein